MEQRIASGLKRRREQLGLSVNDLAERAGVSRAMISKIERMEASPTAALLGKLCSGLGMTLSSLIASAEQTPQPPVVRAADQPVWRDPKTGMRRTMLTPVGTQGAVEIVRIELPGSREVQYPAPRLSYEQQVVVLEGDLSVHLGSEQFHLSSGDCMRMLLETRISFINPRSRTCHYLVVIEKP
jgi:transcriptional regulator with XRE-family HTH domain